MTIGEGIAIAALAWLIVQLLGLLHVRSKMVTVDHVDEKLDRLIRHLEDCLGPIDYTPTNRAESDEIRMRDK